MTTMTIESIVKQMDLGAIKPTANAKPQPKEPLKMLIEETKETEEKTDSVAPPAEPVKYFSFDKNFQNKIVQAFLIDRHWALQFAEVLDVNYFQYAYLKKIAHTYMAYGKKYKEFPSMSLLATIIATDLKNNSDAALRGQIHDFLLKVEENKDLGDLAYVKEKSLDFCKRVGLQKALEASIEFIETEKYEKVVDTIKKAINAGNEHSPGLELRDDIDARYSETYRKTIPTGIAQFDERKILNGGLGAGELGVVISPTGCHAKGTEILMFNGSIQKVEDVKIGDKLMGPDSKARTVLNLAHGRENMYDITPTKGDKFTVNENHILSLKRTNDGTLLTNTVINVSVKDYLYKSKTFKHIHKLWRTGVEFENFDELTISPYMLGLLLGDGYLSKNRIEITTTDTEIIEEIKSFAKINSLGVGIHQKKNTGAVGVYITNNKKRNNPLTAKLRNMNLLGTKSETKFIPQEYKVSNRQDRLELLAGLIDTDGSKEHNCFDYISKSKRLTDDVVFVARSLGLAAETKKCRKGCQTGAVGTYYRACISGNTEIVPVRLERKKCHARKQVKNVLVSGFKVEPRGIDDFYGFALTDDHLYLMGDFTVNHNTGKSHMLVNFGASALLAGKNVLHYTFELNERATGIRYDSHLLDIDSIDCFDNKEKIKQFYADNVETLGRLKIKYYPTGEATVSTLRSHIDKLGNEGFKPDMIIIDYAGIMRSTDRKELLRLELKQIYEEIRGFANEMDLPIWTASQSNKDGANKDFIDLTNMAEAYGQAHVADFILGLARKSLAKSTGYGNIFIAKNRAGVDGIQLQIHLDTARSKLRVISESEFQASKASQENDEESGLTGQFRQKVREFQKNHAQ